MGGWARALSVIIPKAQNRVVEDFGGCQGCPLSTLVYTCCPWTEGPWASQLCTSWLLALLRGLEI